MPPGLSTRRTTKVPSQYATCATEPPARERAGPQRRAVPGPASGRAAFDIRPALMKARSALGASPQLERRTSTGPAAPLRSSMLLVTTSNHDRSIINRRLRAESCDITPDGRLMGSCRLSVAAAAAAAALLPVARGQREQRQFKGITHTASSLRGCYLPSTSIRRLI